ncbi:efflux RND transporter permease subunit [Polynucleobacter sphagniphilus]|jgi:multidrug efflux pump subunit AcrB|uniref:Multidrug efflux pump subunit AcrB n=1 Tax=Polynucleobacter sphagniphilus TaxID=1743169 RepID=A0AA43MCF4_9BURK|nr:efflux RND transporter permease subunit [Polynucleobacter sphagniphilus]MDH6505019.1 multidrug efflux pump subunit AcrB [Polynucleobacter sphagniphilus]MDH6513175.1 multidrug efflux pump subunit AcrB [Polynucleobacter sphagniphilus]
MIRLVKLALEKPYTFIVMSIMIALLGGLAATKMAVDIFPEIRIPVIAVVWTYNGMQPEDMAGRVVYAYERNLSTNVTDIEHIESSSLPGFGIIKVYFQPNVDIRVATAQVTSYSQTVIKQMPPGITPPLILNYNAATVPVIQIALTSKYLAEKAVFDLAQNFIRPQLANVPGSSTTSPFGGKVRQIQIDLNIAALQSKNLSPKDVITALNNGNLIIPTGTEKIGNYEYSIKLNNSIDDIKNFAELPIKLVNGTVIQLRDVAQVRDGAPPQTNLVRLDGGKGVLMTILKSGAISTLTIVDGIKTLIPRLKETLPESLKIQLIGDQSVFVKASIVGVIREGLIAAALTSLMILLFLGSWRSTLIIAMSIPLSVMSAIILLYATGETLNIMTLGGLALAVGMLVDDATVTIENFNTHLEMGKDIRTAIIDGASQIINAAFVAVVCISIVFVPMFFLEGVPKYLFIPMAKAVIFSMFASFVMSQTFVPTIANYILGADHQHHGDVMHHEIKMPPAVGFKNRLIIFTMWLGSIQKKFEIHFERARKAYSGILEKLIQNQKRFVIIFMAIVLGSWLLVFTLGRDFFPEVDGGQIKLHVRLPVGTRLEETAVQFNQIETEIRKRIPEDQIESIVDNIGLNVSPLNNAYNNSGTIGPQDGDIYISLAEGHDATSKFVEELRSELPKQFPLATFSFLPADIVSQILNFGAPAPIDVIIKGRDRIENQRYASVLLDKMKKIPGIVDVRIQQASNYPQINVDVDRVQAAKLGVTQSSVTGDMVSALAGSSQINPIFWLNPENGVSYPVSVQTPQSEIRGISQLINIPVGGFDAKSGSSILGAIANLHRTTTQAVVNHDGIQPSFDIFATTQGRDLGGVAADINRIIDEEKPNRPKGTTVELRGQVATMNSAFTSLGFGIIASVILIYFILVVNFQSWLVPFVIITALPAAIAGIVWMLFLTFTNLSVPALTGVIMCMGVATANSILVVSYAKERFEMHKDPVKAALEAGYSRFRPVIMTASAMIIGMLPMALGLGEGGEQNAPLGRAVIGGLTFATVATLIFVPIVYSLVNQSRKKISS